MNGLIDFWITINKEKAYYRIGDGKAQKFEHDLLEKLAEIRELKRTHEYGTELLISLFPTGIYNKNLHLALEKGIVEENNNVHFRLNIEDTNFEELYWESIQDRDRGQIFGRNNSIFFSRTPSTDKLKTEPLLVDKLRVLVVISEPVDIHDEKAKELNQQPFDKQKELAFLKSLTQQYSKDIEFNILDSPGSIKKIEDSLGLINILYIIGNGFVKDKNTLILQESDENENTYHITLDHLGKVLQGFEHLKLVLFSSGLNSREKLPDFTLRAASRLVKLGIPAAITLRNGMQSAAVELFSRQFFQQLINSLNGEEDKSIDQLVNSSRNEIWFKINRRLGGNDWIKPVLFMRDAGYLFQSQTALSGSENRKVKNSINPQSTETRNIDIISKDLPVLFCGYSSKDLKYQEVLMNHLQKYTNKPRLLKKILELEPAEDIKKTIGNYLEQADFIILLVSADFINEDQVEQYRQEERAVERKKEKKADVFPILVRNVDLEDYFEGIQILPFDKVPIALKGNADEQEGAIEEITRGPIKEAIKRWISKTSGKNLTGNKLEKDIHFEKVLKGKINKQMSKSEAFKMIQDFSEEKLKSLCDSILVNYKNLKGSDVEAKTSALVIRCFNEDALKERFLEALKKPF